MNNLVDNPEYASLQQQLEKELQALLDQAGDAFKDGQYYMDKWGYSWAPGDLAD